jgi:hypothetical protein
MSERRPDRPRIQVVLQFLPGAEPWVKVEHSSGWFRLPMFCAIEELYTGAAQGWTDRTRYHQRAEAIVRVPLAEWRAQQALLHPLRLPADGPSDQYDGR